MCGPLRPPLSLGDLALGRGLVSAITRCLTCLLLLEPTQARPLSLGLLLLTGLLALIRQPLALIRDLFAPVGGPLAVIRDPLALVRDPVTLIRGVRATIRHPLALIGDLCSYPWLSLLPTSLAAQAGTLALQILIIGLELRRTALNLRADALDLEPRNRILLLQPAGAQVRQIDSVGLELCRLAL
jgi:hypothetical protein